MVTDEVCLEKHKRIDERLDEIHTDVKTIRDNHIAHLNEKIDKQTLYIIILAVMAGGQLALKLMGL